jgi:hypothetical protein
VQIYPGSHFVESDSCFSLDILRKQLIHYDTHKFVTSEGRKVAEKQKTRKFARGAQIMDLMCENHRVSFNKFKILLIIQIFYILNYNLVKYHVKFRKLYCARLKNLYK